MKTPYRNIVFCIVLILIILSPIIKSNAQKSDRLTKHHYKVQKSEKTGKNDYELYTICDTSFNYSQTNNSLPFLKNSKTQTTSVLKNEQQQYPEICKKITDFLHKNYPQTILNKMKHYNVKFMYYINTKGKVNRFCISSQNADFLIDNSTIQYTNKASDFFRHLSFCISDRIDKSKEGMVLYRYSIKQDYKP